MSFGVMMVNDEEIREKCRKVICQQLNELDDFLKCHKGYAFDPEVAITIALFYIAANMPSVEEKDFAKREQQGCAFCNSGKDKQQLIEKSFEKICIDSKLKAITLENERQFSNSSKVVSSVVRSFPIAYCPVCGRKL